MKVFYFFVLSFLVSCSSEKDETLDSRQQTLSYFDKIFTNSEPIFNEFNLGDSLIQDEIKIDSLSSSDYFKSSLLVSEEKINEFELNIHIEKDEKATTLMEKIVTKYNVHLNQDKPISNFVTWSYTTDNNLPAEIILIYEKEFKTISLDIGYKLQR